VAPNGITLILVPSFLKIGKVVQKFKGRYTHPDKMVTSCFFFFLIRDSILNRHFTQWRNRSVVECILLLSFRCCLQKKKEANMRFEVLAAVKMSMLFLWVVTPCRLLVRYHRVGETHCLHLQP
jgi:hypothetical protein